MFTKQHPSAAKAAAIVSKPNKPELAGIVPNLVDWFRRHQYELVIDQETAAFTSGLEVVAREQNASRQLNFFVGLGGGGALLSAARAVGEARVSIFRVNIGGL